MKHKILNIKDAFLHVSTFLLHDLDEIAKLQNSPHVNLDKFIMHAYRKVFTEFENALSLIYPNAKLNLLHNIVPFKTFQSNGYINIFDFIKKDTKQTIAEIAMEMGKNEFNNIKEIDYCYINPISNIPGFNKGMKNFTIDLIIKKRNFEMSEENLIEMYSYNPITKDFFRFLHKDGAYLNDYRLAKKELISLKDAYFGIVAQNFQNLKYLPRKISYGSHVIFSDDNTGTMIDFLSNKVDFFISFQKPQNNSEICNIYNSLGYVIYNIDSNCNIIMNDESKNEDAIIGFIASSRHNMNLLRSV